MQLAGDAGAFVTLLLVCVAGLGVLGGVVLDTHERVHDLRIHKALGMTPGQTVAMVVTSVVLPGPAGGALGVSLGLAVHSAVIPAIGHPADLRLPHSVIDVYDVQDLVLLGLAGVAVAVLGSLLPAGWAARVRTATALRAEQSRIDTPSRDAAQARNPLATLRVMRWVTPHDPHHPHPAPWDG